MEALAFKVSDAITSQVQLLCKRHKLPIDAEALAVKTILHAAVYYIPQDIAVIGSALFLRKLYRSRVNPPIITADPRAAIENWAAETGLQKDRDFRVRKSWLSSNYYVTLLSARQRARH